MPDEDEKLIGYEKELLKSICSNCHGAVYQAHHQWPDKYKKCPQCGHTIITKPSNFRMLSVTQD